MSRSNPIPTNPAKRFFKWSGSKGKLVWYDKEQQSEVEVTLPFTFLVLDQLATITGYCEQDGSGYWSNEVRSVAKEEFTVRTSKGTKQAGLYKDLADVRSKGAKYAKSIYIAYKESDEYVIGNIKASGAALTAWIELSDRYVVLNGKVSLTGATQAKKGATDYFIPTFEWSNSDSDEDEIAKSLDKELQIYLSQYLTVAQFDRTSQEDGVIEDSYESVPQNGYEKAKAQAAAIKAKQESEDDRAYQESLARSFSDEGDLNMDDIPF